MKKYRDGKIRMCPVCKENVAECKCSFEFDDNLKDENFQKQETKENSEKDEKRSQEN